VPVRWSLVGSGVNGYAPNRWGLHPLMPMAMLPK
jgi:peptide/nickel transport system substrate-binding protein/oligopeptide transport system substrate-binding protein